MNIGGMKKRVHDLESTRAHSGTEYLKILALEAVLDSMEPEACEEAEAALSELISLKDEGFSDDEIKDRMKERWIILEDLEQRAMAQLPEIQTEDIALHQRKELYD